MFPCSCKGNKPSVMLLVGDAGAFKQRFFEGLGLNERAIILKL